MKRGWTYNDKHGADKTSLQKDKWSALLGEITIQYKLSGWISYCYPLLHSPLGGLLDTRLDHKLSWQLNRGKWKWKGDVQDRGHTKWREQDKLQTKRSMQSYGGNHETAYQSLLNNTSLTCRGFAGHQAASIYKLYNIATEHRTKDSTNSVT